MPPGDGNDRSLVNAMFLLGTGMELNEIRYFLAVCQTLNFTRAAERCRVSQPALTRGIQKMEDELGSLLFSRERNNTHLTDLGQLILPHLREVMERTGTVERTAASFLKLENAHLDVGLMSTIAPQPFTGFMRRFQAKNPGIEVTLQQATPSDLSDLLTVGKLDVALIACTEQVEPPLTSVILYRERFVIGCTTGHRLAAKPEISIRDLDGECYFTRHDCSFSEQLIDICRANGVELKKSFRSERDDWILAMVADGLGICFVPEFTATVPGIVGRPLASSNIERNVCLVTVAGRRASPPVKAFVAAVRQHRWSADPGP